MHTFSRVALVVIGMTSVVAAQPKADSKMAPPAPPADGAMPEMKPAPEIATMAKAVTGTWRCKGQGVDHAMKMTDMTGTMKTQSAVGGWWLHSSFEAKMAKTPFHFESFTTYDAATKKWKRVLVESGGAWAAGDTAAAVGDKKVDWDLGMRMGGAEAMFRDHEDMTDPKVGAKMWGEVSMDKGKTWMKVYEMTCKK